MTRKDLEAITACIRDSKSEIAKEQLSLGAANGAEVMRQMIARDLAREFGGIAASFDKAKFLAACDVQ